MLRLDKQETSRLIHCPRDSRSDDWLCGKGGFEIALCGREAVALVGAETADLI
jgi:hypothetical protein